MDLKTFCQILDQSGELHLCFVISPGEQIAPHFHVTEIGKVNKDFVDCGGIRHKVESCVLQTLVANDTDHRLSAKTLAGIVRLADKLDIDKSSEVEVELQGRSIETWRIADHAFSATELRFTLQTKSTACLAPDRCGIGALPLANGACCSDEPGCC